MAAPYQPQLPRRMIQIAMKAEVNSSQELGFLGGSDRHFLTSKLKQPFLKSG